jgi:NitT/TauT family transport system permease protein
MTRHWKTALLVTRPALVVVALLILWEVGTDIWHPPPFIIPAPSQIFAELYRRPNLYVENGLDTLESTLIAFGIATGIGVLLAIAIVHSKALENTLYTLLIALNSVPKVALAPVFVIWFGTGRLSKVAIAFFIAIFAIVVDAVLGLRTVHPEVLDLAQALGGNRLQVLLKIRMPNALPSIFAGMKVAISLSLVGVIVGEFVAAKQGLGYLILVSQGVFETPSVFAAIFVLAAIGTILFYAIELLERRLLPWHISSRSQNRSIH